MALHLYKDFAFHSPACNNRPGLSVKLPVETICWQNLLNEAVHIAYLSLFCFYGIST
jgi:hypothetical protein